MDTELFKEWFQAFAQSAGATLHVENLYGENNHHIVESCFKGLARALRQAVEIDTRRAGAVPSTKGDARRQLVDDAPRSSITARAICARRRRRSSAPRPRAGSAARSSVTSRPEDIAAAERIVLPGVGAFADCRRGLAAVPGLEAGAARGGHRTRPAVSRHLRRHAADGRRAAANSRPSRASAGSPARSSRSRRPTRR